MARPPLTTTLRSLLKQPAFSLGVVLTLGLGVGANTAIFSVVRAALLAPFPYAESRDLVLLRSNQTVSPMVPMSPAQFETLQRNTTKLQGVVALDLVDLNLRRPDGALRLPGSAVSWDFFSTLGVTPIIGRSFQDTEAVPGHNGVALLSHGVWRDQFGAREDIVGTKIEALWTKRFGPARQLEEQITVIGVLPENFVPPFGTGEVFVPLVLPTHDGAHHFSFLFPFARLSPGSTLEEATAEQTALVRAIQPPPGIAGDEWAKRGVTLRGLDDWAGARVQSALQMIFGAALVLLLAVCANVAGLLISRNLYRRQELAVRSALGATQRDLFGWLMTEGLILGSLGTLTAIGIAYAALQWLRSVQTAFLRPTVRLELDAQAFSFAAVASLLGVILFCVLPSWRSATGGVSTSRGHSYGLRRARVRSSLVVVQISLSMVLLLGAGLLLRSFQGLMSAPLGFEPERLLVFDLALPRQNYPEVSDRAAFNQELRDQLSAQPGVTAVASASALPLSSLNFAGRVQRPGIVAGEDVPRSANLRLVSDGFFETLGVALLSGRTFEAADVRPVPTTVLVDRAFADRFFTGAGDPIGSTLHLPDARIDQATIIGIVASVSNFGPQRDVSPTVYIPSTSTPTVSFALRTGSVETAGRPQQTITPESLTEAVRKTVAAIDPGQPVTGIRTFEDAAGRGLGRASVQAQLMGLFSVLTLVISGVGLFSLMLQTVTQRRREIGLRRAIGAPRSHVRWIIVRQTFTLATIGTLLGWLAALGLGRFLEASLFGIEPSDPVVAATAAAILIAGASLAAWWPASLAARVSPAEVLKNEA